VAAALRHTFAPVLLCCPFIAGMLDAAENLCILEMLENQTNRQWRLRLSGALPPRSSGRSSSS
jgi:hypothetical protein